jgi:peroxiredoxin
MVHHRQDNKTHGRIQLILFSNVYQLEFIKRERTMSTMKTFSITALSMIMAATAFSQKDYKLQFTIKGCEKDTVYLIRYYGDKMYYADTAIADAAGTFSFKGKFAKEGGMYAVMPDDKSGYFEVLLNSEDVQMQTDKSNFVDKMKVLKSKENLVFYDYIRYINSRSKLAEPLRKELDSAKTEAERKEVRLKLEKLDKEVKVEQQRLIKENQGLLISAVIRLSTDIEVPEPPKDANGKVIDSLFQRNYYISHYWDGIDVSDERLMRMAGYTKKLEYFFDKVLPQVSDSIIPQAEKILQRCTEGTEMFKYNVVWLTSHYQNSKIMCLDKVFVYMVLKYYKTGKSFWMPADKNKEIVERAEAMEPLVCGALAHNITLPDTTESNWVKLSDISAKYRILIFWDPDCGHCKKEMPKIIDKYGEFKKLNADIYTVSSKNDKEWKDFVKKHKMPFVTTAVPAKVYSDQNYVNDIVRSGKTDLKSLNYHNTFDIYKTPTIFVIDQQGKIIGKNLESEGLLDYLKRVNEFDTNQ